MKWTIFSLIGVLVILIAATLIKGEGAFQVGTKTALITGAKFLPILFIAFLIMGYSDALMPKTFVKDWLSESSGIRGFAVAWLAGILTPAGSVIGMPLAAGLYTAGAGIGVIITYLTSLALLSVIRVPLEIGFYGYKLMLVRVGATIVLPIVAGLTAQGIVNLTRYFSKQPLV